MIWKISMSFPASSTCIITAIPARIFPTAITTALSKWHAIRENELRSVVFHSLRHSSTSIKLQISCGNIKAVQGDTGHAQARMVTEVYAHTNNEERLLLAQKVDENFFQTPTPGAFAPTSEMQKVLQILAEKPELVRLLAAM